MKPNADFFRTLQKRLKTFSGEKRFKTFLEKRFENVFDSKTFSNVSYLKTFLKFLHWCHSDWTKPMLRGRFRLSTKTLVFSNMNNQLSNRGRNFSRAVTGSIQLLKMFSKHQGFEHNSNCDQTTTRNETVPGFVIFLFLQEKLSKIHPKWPVFFSKNKFFFISQKMK